MKDTVTTIGEVMGYGMFALMNSTVLGTMSIYMMVTTISLPLLLRRFYHCQSLSYLVYKWGFEVGEEQQRAQKAVSTLNNEVLEMIDGTYVIRAYGQKMR